MYNQINKINVYKKIAFNFLFLVLILIGFIIYFIFYKVEIIVKPIKEKIETEFTVKIHNDSRNIENSSNDLKGIVNQTDIFGEKEFSTTGTKEVFTNSTGKVFIINKGLFNQPLVATTRLLTPDNILFRIKSGVTVPAGGEVEVAVYSDDKNFQEIVKPVKMIIPGLSQKLQKIIYAENRVDIGAIKKIKVLSQEDLNIAQEDLIDDLYQQAKEQFNLNKKNKISFNFIGKVPRIKYIEWKKVLSSKINKKIGEETDKFKLSLKVRVVEVSFNENDILLIAKKNILNSLPDDKKFEQIDKKGFSYILDSYNKKNNIALIKVYVSGNMILSENSLILNKDQFLGISNEKIIKQLKNNPAIKNVEIKSPFNLFKFIPKNKNKIKIIVLTDTIK